MKANVAEQEGSKKTSSGNNFLLPICVFGMVYKSEKYSADNTGGNPETVGDNELHLRSQLKAGERVLT